MSYLIAYVAAGALLAVAAYLRHEATLFQHISRSVVVIAFWPLLVLVAPDFIAQPRREIETEANSRPREEPVFVELKSLAQEMPLSLSEEEQSCLTGAAESGAEGTTFFTDSANFGDILHQYWDDEVPPSVYYDLRRARWRLSDDYVRPDLGIRFSLRDPDWFVGFSVEFLKCISKIDKTKRARVLEAIAKIAEAPITPYGDTVKPLTGDYSGLWRFRIGDDRLIYKPSAESKHIILISFAARGSVYE